MRVLWWKSLKMDGQDGIFGPAIGTNVEFTSVVGKHTVWLRAVLGRAVRASCDSEEFTGRFLVWGQFPGG
jgi:hypothetical protein